MFFPNENKDDEQYKKIIIQYDHKITCLYSLGLYNKHPFLNNYITKDKFNDIINKANIILCDAKLKKSKYDKVEINKITYLLFSLAFICTLIFILLFYFTPRNEKYQKKLIITGFAFFCSSIFILLCLEAYNSFRKIQGDRTLISFYKSEIINYVDKLNSLWKDKMIFNYDEKTKNIICYVKIDANNSKNFESNSSSNTENNVDTSSYGTQKSPNKAPDLYSNK